MGNHGVNTMTITINMILDVTNNLLRQVTLTESVQFLHPSQILGKPMILLRTPSLTSRIRSRNRNLSCQQMSSLAPVVNSSRGFLPTAAAAQLTSSPPNPLEPTNSTLPSCPTTAASAQGNSSSPTTITTTKWHPPSTTGPLTSPSAHNRT